ncbi:hypothetical protein MNEG_11399, partial [Monoraphidium neglectum]
KPPRGSGARVLGPAPASGGRRGWLVRWPDGWEPEEHLAGAAQLLAEYKNAHGSLKLKAGAPAGAVDVRVARGHKRPASDDRGGGGGGCGAVARVEGDRKRSGCSREGALERRRHH